MKLNYDPIYDLAIIDYIAKRYTNEIEQLESVGFHKLCIVREMLPHFSFLYLFPLYFLSLASGEPVYLETPLRVATRTPLLVCYETGCIALVFARGVKYYTHFTDGTILISSNFDTKIMFKPENHFYKYSEKVKFENAHLLHQGRIHQFIRQGKELDHHLTYENYATMSQIELNHMLS